MTILEQLKRDEGRRPRPYQDTMGIWTVGYGHNLTVGELSEAAMTQILQDDIQIAETHLLALPLWRGLSAARRGVLVNMCVNMGFAGLMRFVKFYEALAIGSYAVAADEMLDSAWARQVGARATRLARQMREDIWQ